LKAGLCNAENVHVLREFRANARPWWPWAPAPSMAACRRSATSATSGQMLRDVYCRQTGGSVSNLIPNDPELPLPLNHVHPIHEVVHVDFFLAGLPPIG
jgi:NAD-reducing hydrogenase small subunit